MRQLNIAILHYSCPPIVGGVEEIVRQQCLLFRRHYYPVKIFAGIGTRFGTEYEYEVEINPLLGSRHERILQLQKGLSNNTDELRALTEEIFQYLSKALVQFDILIVHNVFTMHYNLPLTYALHKLADSGKIKVIAWSHDSPYFYEKNPIHLRKEPWDILRKYNPNVHYITISESRKKQFLRLFGEDKDIQVISNGIDPIRFFRLDPQTVRIIQENNLFEAEFIMVQPSRLHPRKNIELSIGVVKALQEKGLHARLLLTGSYDPHEVRNLRYLSKIKKLSQDLDVEKDILIMADYLFSSGEPLQPDRIIMRDLYLIADLLFLPSIQEGFGIPLLEAGMIKLPIACSEIFPFKEIGENHVCYFSLRDKPWEIADKIIHYLSNIPPHQMFRKVIHTYVWDNIFHQELRPFLEKIAQKA
jgi:glycosyltransferase involved in cell wall biosynthesis